MGNYVYTDIATEEEFDLKIEHGDIVLEEAPLALANTVAFRVMTQPAEWVFDPAAVSGIRNYLGGINSEELRSRIRLDIFSVVFKGFTIRPTDIGVDILQSTESATEAIIIIELKNINYTDKDNVEHHDESVQSTYYLDTLTGKLTFIDDII